MNPFPVDIQFIWPLMGLWLLAPVLWRIVIPAHSGRRSAALRTPFLEDFSISGKMSASSDFDWLRGSLLTVLAWAAWVCFVCALMRPQWIGDWVEVPATGRDLMLAVDLSESMLQKDFVLQGRKVDRLTATKSVARDFIERRVGDRIGLILFGLQAYQQAPLTFDRRTVRSFLDEAVVGLAGKKTAIGDAIGLAVKRLRGRDERDRVLILITDGANTAGAVAPLEAANKAAKDGLKIHTIGIGSEEQIVQGFFGARRVNPSADLDEKTLRAISESTGGQYFRARDVDELEKIYQILDDLEPAEDDPFKFRPQRSLFHFPLGAAALLASLFFLALLPRSFR
ncbi:MAG: vWA domain-containing protein [Candidatus Eutrophobiaceae bacterium]